MIFLLSSSDVQANGPIQEWVLSKILTKEYARVVKCSQMEQNALSPADQLCTFEKVLNFSQPVFSLMFDQNNNSIYFTGLQRALNDSVYTELSTDLDT